MSGISIRNAFRLNRRFLIADPFFGVSRGGKIFARILNRIVIITEISVLALYLIAQYKTQGVLSGSTVGIAIVVWILIVSILNKLLSWIWNLLFVLFMGTADPAEIDQMLYQRETKRRGPSSVPDGIIDCTYCTPRVPLWKKMIPFRLSRKMRQSHDNFKVLC